MQTSKYKVIGLTGGIGSGKTFVSNIFKRLNIASDPVVLTRLATTWLEVTHAVLLIIITSKPKDKSSIISDLKHMIMSLLEKTKSNF